MPLRPRALVAAARAISLAMLIVSVVGLKATARARPAGRSAKGGSVPATRAA